MKVLASFSIKGGVGKTTAAVNLAHEAAAVGARVLLWDLDPQGAATYFMRLTPLIKGGAQRLASAKGALEPHLHGTDQPGLHVVPADFSLRYLDIHLGDAKRPRRRITALLDPLADQYDVVILDCPPGITLASESVLRATDFIIVPTIPTTLSRRTLDQLSDFLADMRDPPVLLTFASMVDRRKSLHRDVIAGLIATVPGYLPTVIPNASVIERMGVERAAVRMYAPDSPGSVAFHQLWLDIAQRLWPD